MNWLIITYIKVTVAHFLINVTFLLFIMYTPSESSPLLVILHNHFLVDFGPSLAGPARGDEAPAPSLAGGGSHGLSPSHRDGRSDRTKVIV